MAPAWMAKSESKPSQFFTKEMNMMNPSKKAAR